MLTNNTLSDIIFIADGKTAIEAWLSLVERCVRDAEVVGSNPVASTPWQGHRKILYLLGFPVFFGCFSMYRKPSCKWLNFIFFEGVTQNVTQNFF